MAFWNDGKVRYGGGGGYGDINLDYFGSGDIRLDDPVLINTRATFIGQSLRFKVVGSRFFVGPMHRYASAKLRPGDLDGLGDLGFDDDDIRDVEQALTEDVKNSGLGITIEFDSRDNIFSPHKGYQYRLGLLRFDDATGSDNEYNLYKLEALNYWRFSDKWRGGLKLVSEHTDADDLLPPFATPSLSQRGVPTGRYQGLHAQSLEVELATRSIPAGNCWDSTE